VGILKALGVVVIVLWLVLWLAVKITFGAIHLLLVLGIALLVIGFIKAVWLHGSSRIRRGGSIVPCRGNLCSRAPVKMP
jgi:hypothetical protein